MSALPLFKIGVLAVRTVSKPVANQLKAYVSGLGLCLRPSVADKLSRYRQKRTQRLVKAASIWARSSTKCKCTARAVTCCACSPGLAPRCGLGGAHGAALPSLLRY